MKKNSTKPATKCQKKQTNKKTPHLLHVIPVSDDAVLDGVLQSQDSPLALGLVSHVAVFLTHTHHDTLTKKSDTFKTLQTFLASPTLTRVIEDGPVT